MDAVSAGEVPGVVKASASDTTAVISGAVLLGLLVIIFGTTRSNGPGSGPTHAAPPSPDAPIIVEAVPVPPSKEGETPADVLKPNGQNVGVPGSRPDIRVLPGGEKEARDLFDRLTQRGEDITPPGHPGQMIKTPDGSIIGYRSKSKSGPPTIDVNVKGLETRKLKFPNGAAE